MSRFKKTAVLFLLCAMLLAGLFGCSEKERTLSWCELSLVLTGDYEEIKSESFDKAMSDGRSVVGITRMSFEAALDDGIPTTLTPRAFAEEYKRRTEKTDCQVLDNGEVPYITYVQKADGQLLHYTVAFYRSDYAYFSVVFVTYEEYAEEYSEKFLRDMKCAYLDYTFAKEE